MDGDHAAPVGATGGAAPAPAPAGPAPAPAGPAAPAPAPNPAASKVQKRSWANIMASGEVNKAKELATKGPAPAKKPRGAPRKGHIWDGKHKLEGGAYSGAWVPDPALVVDDGSDGDGDAAAEKKQKRYRPYQKSWLAVLPWLTVAATAAATICAAGGSG